jgi:signal transduction histidine kinase
MAQRDGWQAGSWVVTLVAVAMLAVAGAFTWLRTVLPSEPAAILTDAWDWTATGVVVVPVGEGGPFEIGDRVTAIDGTPVEDLAGAAVAGPWGPGPRPVTDAARRQFTIARAGGEVDIVVGLGRQPIGGLLAAALPLIAYTIAQAGVALLAWLRRPAEGWRRGFLVGSIANVANALIWELGLRPTDLDRPEPMLLLFAIGIPLHLVFWSSVAHVMVSWPSRAPGVLGSRGFVIGLYALPQVAAVTGLAWMAAVLPSTLEWLGLAQRVIALLVLVMIGVILVALASAYGRIRRTAGRSLRLIVVGCLVGAVAVGGLTALPVLLTGQALAPRSAVAAIGLPLAVVLLLGTLRSQLFEVDVLLASRRQLVMAREEERRRIRRDLHDGIGPMLAAMTLKADLARDVLREDPDAADLAIASLKEDTRSAIAEIRRLTRDLRPPALDDLGLAEAIRQRAAELSRGEAGHRLEITVTTPGPLPALDAAAEVAAYRIALEAMTNVLRHTHAGRCEVRLEVRGPLVVEIRDDGPGFPAGLAPGVGLTSMRERCAELGGRLAIERTDDGWTVVRATLPLAD